MVHTDTFKFRCSKKLEACIMIDSKLLQLEVSRPVQIFNQSQRLIPTFEPISKTRIDLITAWPYPISLHINSCPTQPNIWIPAELAASKREGRRAMTERILEPFLTVSPLPGVRDSPGYSLAVNKCAAQCSLPHRLYYGLSFGIALVDLAGVKLEMR